jgi:hypothetical protein
MGAWGIGGFDNDMALDFSNSLIETSDLSLIDSALSTERAGGFLDADKASEAIAACEVLAAALGRAGPDLPDSVREWVAGHARLKFRDVKAKALAALDEVLTDESELNQLWKENEAEFSAWRQGVEALRKRISSVA